MKASEIRGLKQDDIVDMIAEHKLRLNELKYAHAMSPIEQPARIRAIRRDIARLNTILHERYLLLYNE